jgi:hypothetical protein
MIQVNISSVVNGGFIEGNVAYQKRWGIFINSRPLPTHGELLVSDASSPVANFRVEEAFNTLVALAQAPNSVTVLTDLGCGGTHGDYGHLWNLTPKSNFFWQEFYNKTALMDRINNNFAPISEGVLSAIDQRKLAILSMWDQISPYLKSANPKSGERLKVKVYEEEFAELKISDIGNAVPEGAVIATFPCVVCSHQAQTTVYHAIRRRQNGMYVAKTDRSPSHSGCKGGFPWNERWNDLTIWEATYLLGARLSGKAIYQLSSQASNKPAMMVRDYSDPRGTIATTVNNWSQDLWISPRVYLVSEENGSIEGFQASIKNNPKDWAKIIEEFPLFGNGRQFDVIY